MSHLLKVHSLLTARNYQQINGSVRLVSQKSIVGKTLAIRREDQSVWERRAPLAPANVRRLVKEGAKVLVQPSNRRAYPMMDYQQAGAIFQEDISEAEVIVGVKQVPIDALLPNKTYCFFSHTIKAQEANMPLLDAILEKNIRLIDYERMVDWRSQRVVAFGKYAGAAGMINILHGLGLRLLALGHHTPLMHVGPAHNYRNTEMARAAIRDAGYEISLGRVPKSIGPLTFVFTGSGNVSQGAQEIFRELPHEYVTVDMLKKVAELGGSDLNKIYYCEVSRPDHLVRKEGGGYDEQEYNEFPERYLSNFSSTIAPYASVIINGIYWAPNSPRLLTIPDMKTLLTPSHTPWLPSSKGCPRLPHRLLALCDISADPGGSLEFMTECTTIDTPFCLYDAEQHQNKESFMGDGVLVCSIDNMPTQVPREATDFFGDLLFPYMADILQSEAGKPFESHNFCHEVHSAVIASNGKLTSNFEYISQMRQERARSTHKVSKREAGDKKVLILGAGHVSEPVVEYLTRDSNIKVTVASALQTEADHLANRYPNTEPMLLDVGERDDLLEQQIKDSDVVVSLLPWTLHPHVLKHCIQHKINMCTASYCTPAMRALHEQAEEAGITVVNEVGLDPGIDHLLAMECFEDVQRSGGKIDSFISYCGGLPAPEHANNPLRYKFSWSPQGMLMATVQQAKFLKEGKEVSVPGNGGLLDVAEEINYLPGFSLEGYPNRDSTIYKDLYRIPEVKTLLRGTMRYRGFSTAMKGLLQLGLLNNDPLAILHPKGPEVSWKEILCDIMGKSSSMFHDNFISEVAKKVENQPARVQALMDLGLTSDDPILRFNTPLDTFCHYIAEKLAFQPGERDLVIMHHDVKLTWQNQRREQRGITMVCYGDPNGYSAMAKTVGYPCAIATKMILAGEIQGRGMVLPFTRDIYKPILARLKQEGIGATETITPL